MKARIWTAANAVMLLMFVFSAIVQVNDPDPFGWMAIYAAAATVCGLEMRRKAALWLLIAVAVVAFVWSGFLAARAHDVPISALFAEWEMRDLRVEEAREMYGLAIVAAWMLVILGVRWARRRRP